MSKAEKLTARFSRKPKNFTWKELQTLLNAFGYEEEKHGKTGGSRVKFFHKLFAPILLHRPHPGPHLKDYQVTQVYNLLKEDGLI